MKGIQRGVAVILLTLLPVMAMAGESVLVPVRTVNMPLTVSAYGVVHQRSESVLASKVLARVVGLPLREGDRLKTGDLVVELDHRDLDAELAVAEAALQRSRAILDQAAAEYKRVQSLSARGSATTRELERAASAHRQAAEAVTEAGARNDLVKTRLGYTRILAPFDGQLVSRLTEVGELAAPGTPLVKVESVGKPELWADVPQNDLSHIRVGMAATVNVHGMSENLAGTVTRIVPAANPRSHTFTVKVSFSGVAADHLHSGMFGQVDIPYGTVPVLAVPASAIVHRSEVAGVYVAGADGTLSLRLVRPGDRLGDDQVILSGLSGGERVAVDADVASQRMAESPVEARQ